ncbi:uncharacterized protein A1O9_01039 [Exophiala aquamarina CBS 119918]|uniref:CFEM domain-containing protein n=1 Tax=Exophiala aquamarina CBS 119918 TaxID=1182545 RepID=A0A072PUM6_9EURO|nr:uncharacterized protein A1O9_01039 [Exophiala aquamarina CBS 119918]KEF63063.1 hypothetical protein A1O9_01039 [Exophiala aquamarina CBS 119918]
MQLSVLLSTTLVAVLVSAQTAPTLPSCATDCITNSLPANCNADPSCICNTPSFIEGIACCVFTACDTADQQAALAYAHGVCDPVGASSLLPASAGCSSTSTSGNGTAAATGSTTSGSGTASTTASGSSSAAATSSAASAASSVASTASSAASASAASATSSPAAGDRLAVQGLGAVGAAVLGLAAFL